MTFLQQIPGVVELLCMLAAGSFGVAIFLIVMLRRNERKTEERLRQARADIADMTILFQTMRDIIGQQKALAREFNEELEHKMGQVKHILNLGMEKNKQLYDKQQRIATELEEAQARIDGLYRQLSSADKATRVVAPKTTPTPPPQPAPPVRQAAPEARPARHDAPEPREAQPARPPVVNPDPAPGPPQATTSRTTSVLVRRGIADVRDNPAVVGAMPRRTEDTPGAAMPDRPETGQRVPDPLAETGITRAAFTPWRAEDLGAPNGAGTTLPPARPAAPKEPESMEDEETAAIGRPGNGEAAREAFRALLNMPMAPGEPVAPPDMPGSTSTRADRGDGYGAGENTLSPSLQQRVLEYSDAGMTVAEVSRELGIGKGEVRLMLSLARQNPPGTL